jgi:branched-chain amino acid aminotransferase
LDGVTRKSVIALAEKAGIEVKVYRLTVDELVAAANDGSLKEIFGAGTAAVISPVSGFSYKEKTYELPKVNSSFATQFKKQLMDIQHNASEDPFGWRYEVR